MPAPILDRRTVLKGAGVALALPMLEAMLPRFARAAGVAVPRRMVCINSDMGVMPQFFWPTGSGRDYKPSDYLALLQEYRRDFTVFSGVSHPDVDGGHHADASFLTAAPHPGTGGFRNTISLDQFAAERVGVATRFPSLSLAVSAEDASASWNAAGVRIPAERRPSEVFKRLFVQGNATQVREQVRQLRDGRSVLDAVGDRARRLQGKLGGNDREKLAQYFDSVRELETRLVKAEAWEKRPKPKVTVPVPEDINDPTQLVPRTRLMFDVIRLALETDSTRIVTLAISQIANSKVDLPGVSEGHHSLTHHGNRDDTVRQLKIIESAQMKVLGDLLGALKDRAESGETLLDRTMVLYGSNLGVANSHDNTNLPIILAGGGFRHGQLLAFDQRKNQPLPNLFVSMLQRMGVEADRFASSTGTMRGLEMV